MKAKLFNLVDEDFDNDFVSFLKFTKNKKIAFIFDDDNKLKFIKKLIATQQKTLNIIEE